MPVLQKPLSQHKTIVVLQCCTVISLFTPPSPNVACLQKHLSDKSIDFRRIL